MSEHKPYMVVFQDNTPKDVIDQEIANVEKAGGKLKQRFDSSILKGFSAFLPDNQVLAYTQLTSNKDGPKDKTHIEYIEPDSEVHTMGGAQ